MADHLVLSFSILGWVRSLHVLLGVGAGHPPAGHQHDNVPDVCDVGNGPQRVVHHGLLGATGRAGESAHRTLELTRWLSSSLIPAEDGTWETWARDKPSLPNLWILPSRPEEFSLVNEEQEVCVGEKQILNILHCAESPVVNLKRYI